MARHGGGHRLRGRISARPGRALSAAAALPASDRLHYEVISTNDYDGGRGHVLCAYNTPSQLLRTEDQATNVLENVYDRRFRICCPQMVRTVPS